MRKTIRRVTMVVPVLMTSCQVSEKWKIGPLTSQMTMTATAMMNAAVEPVFRVAAAAKRSKPLALRAEGGGASGMPARAHAVRPYRTFAIGPIVVGGTG